jgi:hypothetical protein
MNVDEHWLDDNSLTELSRRVPSTDWGRQWLRDLWPKMHPVLMPSELYRGYAMALSILCAHVRPGIRLSEIGRIIDSVDEAAQTATSLPVGAEQTEGFALAIASAASRTQSGAVPADQLVAAFESELIYVARLFEEARRHENAGVKLP